MAVSYSGIPREYELRQLKTFTGAVNSVLKLTETDVLTITVPPSETFICTGGSATGMVDTIFRLYINNILKETLKINWCQRAVSFGVTEKVPHDQIVKITAFHKNDILQDFDASIFGIKLEWVY